MTCVSDSHPVSSGTEILLGVLLSEPPVGHTADELPTSEIMTAKLSAEMMMELRPKWPSKTKI